MGSAFHQLCPRYSGTLTPTAPTAIRLWETFTFTFFTTMRDFFTRVQENYNILKDFVLKRTFIVTTCRFTPKTMNLITSHFVTCLCNILSGLQMQIYQSAPQTGNIFYSIHAVTRVRSNPRTRDVNEINNWEPCNLFPVV